MYSIFCIANEKLYINSTHKDSLGILGFNKEQGNKICKEREKKPFDNYDDLKNRIKISKKKFQKLIDDNRIAF